MNYGLPYMGSKNIIAEWVLSHLPKRENLYDIFCGGCAITHCAMVKDKFDNYYINDINGTPVNAFIKALNGGYKDENRWISREEFHALKGSDDFYALSCFSFGNKIDSSYAYSRENEVMKKASHYAIFFNDYSLLKNLGIDIAELPEASIRERYLVFINLVKPMAESSCLKRLQLLENLTRLQRLQSLEIERNVTSSSTSYNSIEIKPNSVIYCDPPYINTATYNKSTFDHEAFYKWCEEQTELVIISEYYMPDDRFTCIGEKEKVCNFSATNNNKITIEKLFIPNHQVDMYKREQKENNS
ncbi:MAG: DNA adenine methylase [Bacteroidales bacterium]